MRIEYVSSVSEGMVRFYRSDDGYEGFHFMSLSSFREYLAQERASLDKLETELAELMEDEDV
jgi:hypothetical protein